MSDQPPARVVPPVQAAEAARLQAEAVYSVTAGPESTASDEDVAKAKARLDGADPAAPDADWLHPAD